jgi:hydrogenase maturation protease
VAPAVPEQTKPTARSQRASVVVIGVGNALRHDDAAGLLVVRSLSARAQAAGIAVHEQEGEPLALLDIWEGADAVVLVDAISSGGAPGSVRRLDASSAPLPARLRGLSTTHAVGVGEAIELARALHRLPERVVLFGVEGRRFDAGEGLSDELEAVAGRLAETVLREARELRGN